jgi:hypothetical protein
MLELSNYNLLVMPIAAGFLDFVRGGISGRKPSWYTIQEGEDRNRYRFSLHMFCLEYSMLDGIEKSIDRV